MDLGLFDSSGVGERSEVLALLTAHAPHVYGLDRGVSKSRPGPLSKISDMHYP